MSQRRARLVGGLALVCIPLVSLAACSSDDSPVTANGGNTGNAGRGGAGGRAGSSGAAHAGVSGSSTSGGSAGHAGDDEMTAEAGAAGSAGSSDGGASGAAGAPSTEPIDVTISFAAQVGGKPFACNQTYDLLGTAGFSATPLDFRFYVHAVKLSKADKTSELIALTPDGLWQSDKVALLDFEDKTGTCSSGSVGTNTVVKGKVKPGNYTGVSFIIGVPFDLNHSDQATATPPLDDSGLWWGWASGYRFMKIDFQPQPLGSVTAPPMFLFHLGSTDCVGSDPNAGLVSSCGRPNLAPVELSGFDAATNHVVIDYAKLVAHSNLGVNAAGAPGCMSGVSDPECVGPFARIGLDLINGTPSGNQSVFSVQ
jgi:uncharacterized repeat protein (TIGR04052 family)